MTPKEQIAFYINDVGTEEAAKFFNKKESTIQTWMKTKNFPGEAYEIYYGQLDADTQPAPIEPEAIPEPPTVEERLHNIEQFMLKVSEWIGQQPVPAAAPNPMGGPLRPWVEAAPGAPGESNFTSLVRPQATVPSKASYDAGLGPVQQVTVKQAGLRPGMTPADTWLNPIKTPRK